MPMPQVRLVTRPDIDSSWYSRRTRLGVKAVRRNLALR